MLRKSLRILAILAAVLLPMGLRFEMAHETTKVCVSLSWAGLRVSPCFAFNTDLSRWIQNNLNIRPAREGWTQTSGGPFWSPWVIGTPPGNWLFLRTMHQCYVAAPADEKAEVCFLSNLVLTTRNHKRRLELQKDAVNRWLLHL